MNSRQVIAATLTTLALVAGAALIGWGVDAYYQNHLLVGSVRLLYGLASWTIAVVFSRKVGNG